MKLYLVRHAIAEDALPGQSDDSRALSAPGIARFKQVVQGLARLDIELDHLYHSPKLRAVQTAELLVPLLKGETTVTPHLAVGPGPELLKTIVGESVALVGHEPWLSSLCAWLLTGHPDGGQFLFKKGGVALMEGSPRPGGMKLVGFWSPRVLRRQA
jgi:phosphohistidine phosphatase